MQATVLDVCDDPAVIFTLSFNCSVSDAVDSVLVSFDSDAPSARTPQVWTSGSMCALPLSADERSPSSGITIEPSSAQQNALPALPALPIYGALALLTSVRRALDHFLLHTFVGLLMFIWAAVFTASSAAIGCYTLVCNAILSGCVCAPQTAAPTVSPVDEHRAS